MESLSVRLSAFQSVCFPVFQSVRLFACTSVCLSVPLPGCPSVRLPVCLFVRLPVYPFIHLSFHPAANSPSVRLSVGPPVRVSVFTSIRRSVRMFFFFRKRQRYQVEMKKTLLRSTISWRCEKFMFLSQRNQKIPSYILYISGLLNPHIRTSVEFGEL